MKPVFDPSPKAEDPLEYGTTKVPVDNNGSSRPLKDRRSSESRLQRLEELKKKRAERKHQFTAVNLRKRLKDTIEDDKQ